MPSPSAALTSPPSFSSRLTVAISPSRAASATVAAGAADNVPHTAKATTRTLPHRFKSLTRIALLPRRRGRRRLVQVEGSAAVAEAWRLDAERVQDREHRVGHRRAVGGAQVDVALDGAAAVP